MITLHLDEQLGWRGGEQQASYLIRGLAARGHMALVAGRPQGKFLYADHGCEDLVRIAAPFRGELDLFSAYRIAQAVKHHRVDIIHAHTSHTHTTACLARAIARRGKVVVSRRVDFVPKRNAFNRFKYSWPDHIIAISGRIGQVLSEFGAPTEKLSVVHSCIDAGRFDVAPISRADLDVPEDAPLLGNVAALVGHKDHRTLISAMPRVLERIPRLRLVIVGEGELRARLEAQITSLGLGSSVRLLGFRDDVPRILRALDVFVLSSKLEGLGTSVLDAMAAGVPVVATAGGGIPEMVTHEKTGLLCPVQDSGALAEQIIRAFEESALTAALARNAADLVQERFTTDKMVEGNLRVYERILARS
ncbi:MAG: glycosyltransferase [Candidatus Hydrogenedentes bacterium]|nr:glycosyltransferase [Candidatus Hydrogenedentota bacterium]